MRWTERKPKTGSPANPSVSYVTARGANTRTLHLKKATVTMVSTRYPPCSLLLIVLSVHHVRKKIQIIIPRQCLLMIMAEPLREFSRFIWWMYRTAPSGRRPKTKPDYLGCKSACTGCQSLYPPSPLLFSPKANTLMSMSLVTQWRQLWRHISPIFEAYSTWFWFRL